jgi:thioredoxin-related protein
MKRLAIFIALITSQLGFAQEQTASLPEVEWMTIEEAYALSKENPKKILIDVYTDWCGWCKRMDKTTYANAEIVKYINENYYPVKFDAEQKEDITILDNTFKFVESGRNGYHELAVALLNGKLSYPTTVFLDEGFQLIQPVPGYLDAAGIEPILWFFATDAYKTGDWQAFEKSFNSKL